MTPSPPAVVLTDRFDPGLFPSDYLDRYFFHILCYGGTGQFKLGQQTYHISSHDIVILLPTAEATDFLFSPDFQASFLLLGSELLGKNNPDVAWGIRAYLFSQENPVIPLSETEVATCQRNFAAIHERYNDRRHRFHNEVVSHQLQIFVLDMWNLFAEAIERRSQGEEGDSLFERFLFLVKDHCWEQREVGYYSTQLHITPKYLTELCKKNSGLTALEWIHKFTTQHTVTLLRNPNLTLSQIADSLNFSSPSFFSRYVRKHLGMSPSEYRDRLHQAQRDSK